MVSPHGTAEDALADSEDSPQEPSNPTVTDENRENRKNDDNGKNGDNNPTVEAEGTTPNVTEGAEAADGASVASVDLNSEQEKKRQKRIERMNRLLQIDVNAKHKVMDTSGIRKTMTTAPPQPSTPAKRPTVTKPSSSVKTSVSRKSPNTGSTKKMAPSKKSQKTKHPSAKRTLIGASQPSSSPASKDKAKRKSGKPPKAPTSKNSKKLANRGVVARDDVEYLLDGRVPSQITQPSPGKKKVARKDGKCVEIHPTLHKTAKPKLIGEPPYSEAARELMEVWEPKIDVWPKGKWPIDLQPIYDHLFTGAYRKTQGKMKSRMFLADPPFENPYILPPRSKEFLEEIFGRMPHLYFTPVSGRGGQYGNLVDAIDRTWLEMKSKHQKETSMIAKANFKLSQQFVNGLAMAILTNQTAPADKVSSKHDDEVEEMDIAYEHNVKVIHWYIQKENGKTLWLPPMGWDKRNHTTHNDAPVSGDNDFDDLSEVDCADRFVPKGGYPTTYASGGNCIRSFRQQCGVGIIDTWKMHDKRYHHQSLNNKGVKKGDHDGKCVTGTKMWITHYSILCHFWEEEEPNFVCHEETYLDEDRRFKLVEFQED